MSNGPPQQVLELRRQLDVLGFTPGERFQLARIVKGGARATRTADPEVALRWAGRDRANLYLALNPVLAGADPPGGMAREEDMACARVLYVDCDPADVSPEARAAACELALRVRAHLEQELGVAAPLVDSGRGHGLWLRHEPIAAGLAAETRHLLLRGLAHDHRAQLAKVDEGTWGARTGSRALGSTNVKTGESVRLLDPGDGRVASWSAVVAMAAAYQRTLPPPAEGPKLTPEIRGVMQEIKESPGSLIDAYRWWGAATSRAHGLHDVVRPHVPDRWVDDFDEGARYPHRKWPRPFDEAFAKRANRALEGLEAKGKKAQAVTAAAESIEILSIVRRTEGVGRGAKIDLRLLIHGQPFSLNGLTGAELASYAVIRTRAMAEGALLPDLDKGARTFWAERLQEGWQRMQVEVIREGTTHRALVDAICLTLREAKVGRTVGDFLRGHVVDVGEDRVAMEASELMLSARNKVLPDVVSREQVLDAARELGVDSTARPVLPDGSRRRAWTFPRSVLTSDD